MLGWILLWLLGLLLLLLLLPVGLELRYKDDELRVRARVLGFKVSLVPRKPTKPRKPKKEKQTGKAVTKAKPKEKKEPLPAMDLLQTINDLLPEVGRLLGSTLRHVTVKRLRARIAVSGEDAGQVGISYGQMNLLCYNIYVYLASITRLRNWEVALVPDWDGEHPVPLYLELWLRASPMVLLAIVLRFILRGGLQLYRSPYMQADKTANKTKTNTKKDGA